MKICHSLLEWLVYMVMLVSVETLYRIEILLNILTIEIVLYYK